MRLIVFQFTKGERYLLTILIMVILWLCLKAPFTLAQVSTAVIPTTGVGDLGTKVMPDGNTIKVTGGMRLNNGTNLFHSFDQFNVGRGDTAQFLNTTPSLHTSNILSRVTGGNLSSIFGTIDTMSYPESNLFLMNPAGIVFGPNATLNVGGSVAFTTADYLRLAEATGANAGIFHADTALPNLLTSSPVAAFGFLGSNPAAIAVQGSKLTVEPGQSITLIGGNFTAQSSKVGNGIIQPAYISASDGLINIASVASPGEILARTLDLAPNINGQSSETLGKVEFSQSGINNIGEDGGIILIRGGHLVIDTSKISSNTGNILLDTTSIAITNSEITTETSTAANAGHINLKALKNIDLVSITVFSGSEVSLGNAGNITLHSNEGKLDITKSSLISEAFKGNAGDLTLTAAGSIDLDTTQIITQVISNPKTSSGHAGNIAFNSSQDSLHFTKSFVASQATGVDSGDAGVISMETLNGDIFLKDGTQVANQVQGKGTLGGIEIVAKNLFLNNASVIDGDNFSKQVAGNIEVTLQGRLSLTEGSNIETGTPGLANAADLNIRAHDILITGESSLFSGTIGSGAGGTINLSARSLTIQNGGKISAETSGGDPRATSGSITINATDHVTLANGASISASSSGPANAGNISINAGQQLEIRDGSSITTQTARASGGNIDIRAIDRIRLVNSNVSTSVLAQDGTGGNIFIDPNVVILEGSAVTARAVTGAGGNITFVTPLFLADSTSIVSASSEFGPDGKVTARSNLIATIPQLESKATEPQALLQNRCIALAGGEQSTFIVAGRDALPSEPGGWLSSPISMEHWTGENMEHASGLMVRSTRSKGLPAMAGPKGETTVLSLRRLTPPGFLVRSFATGTTGCPS